MNLLNRNAYAGWSFFLLSFITFTFSESVVAQPSMIQGSTTVNQGQVYTYTLYNPDAYGSVWYSPYGGTIISYNNQSAEVRWLDNASGIIAVDFEDSYGYHSEQLNVTITFSGPDVPNISPSTNSSCGQSVLSYSTAQKNSIPAGTNWFWQGKNSNGTNSSSVNNVKNANYVVSTGTGGIGTYYVRAYDGSNWSSSSRAVSVSYPAQPQTPTVYNKVYCGSTVTLSATSGYAQYEWFDQNNISLGVSTSHTKSESSSGLTSYRVKVKNSSGCWSNYSNTATVTYNGPDLTTVHISGESYCNSGGAYVTLSSMNAFSTFGVGTEFKLYKNGSYYTSKYTGQEETDHVMKFGPYTTTSSDNYTLGILKSGCSEKNLGETAIISKVSGSVSVNPSSFPMDICSSDTSFYLQSSKTSSSYTWYRDESIIPGATSRNYYPMLSDQSENLGNHDYRVKVYYSSSCGYVTSSPLPLNIISQVTPSVGISIEGSTTICAGESRIFHAVNPQNGGSNKSFTWKVNGVTKHTSTISSWNTSGNYTLQDGDVVTVWLTSSEQCVSTPTVQSSNSKIMNVVSPPTGATIVGESELCSPGDNGYFTVMGVEGGENHVYEWYKNGAVVTDNQSSESHTYQPYYNLQTGDQIYCKVSSTGCSTSVPTDTLSVTINQPTDPYANINMPAENYCEGNEITFYSATNLHPATYSWVLNTGSEQESGTGINFTTSNYTPSSVLTLTVTGGGTCISSSTQHTKTFDLEASGGSVNPILTPSVGISIEGSVTICAGESRIFHAVNPQNGGSNQSFTWKVNGVTKHTSTISSWNTSGNYTLQDRDVVTVWLTSSEQCVSTPTVQSSNSKIMNVVSPPTGATIVGESELCSPGDNGYFTVMGVEGGENHVYEWYKNGAVVTDNQSSESHTYQPYYNLQTGDQIYCKVSSTGCSTSVPTDTLSVTINQPTDPYANINMPAENYCEGNEITFYSATNLHPATYSWVLNTGSEQESGTGINFTTSNYTPSSVLTLTVTGGGTCISSSTQHTKTFDLEASGGSVNPILTPSVGISIEGSVTICAGESRIFHAVNPQNGGSNQSFTWKVNGVTKHTSTISSWNTSGNYTLQDGDVVTVWLTSSEQCVSTPTVQSSNSKIMNVVSPPTGATIVGESELCSPGDNGYFTVMGVEGGENHVYEWYKNGAVVTDNQSSESHTYQPYYNLQTGDQVYCKVSSMGCSTSVPTDTLSVTINQPTTPSASIGLSDILFCAGDQITFTPTTNLTLPTFSWVINEGLPGQETATGNVFSTSNFTENSVVKLTVTGRGECLPSATHTTTLDLSLFPMQIDPWLVAPIPESQNYIFCKNQEMVLEAGSVENYHVNWYDTTESLITQAPTLIIEEEPREIPYIYKYKLYPKSGNCKVESPDFGLIKVFVNTYCDDLLNTVLTTTFSIDAVGAQTISSSKSYFDQAGQLMQTQSKSFESNMVFATEPLYDSYDRSVGATLSAPIYDPDGTAPQTVFGYKVGFVQANSTTTYNHANFHLGATDKTDAPDPVYQGTPGTLGWYYSNNNTLEDRVPTTQYPYNRNDFYEDGSGEIKRAAGPGDHHRMGAGHEVITKTLPVGDGELPNYLALRKKILGSSSGNSLERIYKQINIDPNGRESVTYVGENGSPIATALIDYEHKENPVPVYLSTDIKEIHIPRDANNSTVNVSFVNSSTVIISNKVDETQSQIVTTATDQDLAPGIYSIEGAGSISYDAHYTDHAYNFYDNAGRLAASIAPLGMAPSGGQPLVSLSVAEIESMTLTYTTFYKYDFLGRMVQMDEPDAGITRYVYRKDGSIRFSQNQQQFEEGKFSYTSYDVSGRPVESGEYNGSGTAEFGHAAMSSTLENTLMPGQHEFSESERADWVETRYDLPESSHITDYEAYLNTFYDQYYGTPGHPDNAAKASLNSTRYKQEFTYGAVSYTKNENVTTWYSYDEFGRVTSMMMNYAGMGDRFFTLDYTYDFTGNVLEVAYQKHIPGEAFYHHYTYDKDNRLKTVSTSVDGQNQYLQAEYQYYLHGPLKRVEYASDLQGIDYTYTIQGWLKAINNPANTTDTTPIDPAKTFNNDAFGMTLEYFSGDYATDDITLPNIPLSEADAGSQYSGNIRAAAWSRDNLSLERHYDSQVNVDTYDATESTIISSNEIVLEDGFDTGGSDFEAYIDPEATYIEEDGLSNLYAYRYDEKYQLQGAKYSEEMTSPSFAGEYDVSNLTYDANGNILSLLRNDKRADVLDNFTYDYSTLNTRSQPTNQLTSVSGYSGYAYNSIGQLTASTVDMGGQRAEYGNQYYQYDVTGKVTAIYDEEIQEGSQPVVTYQYDDRGFRIAKADQNKTTWYVRDASGNIVSIYEEKNSETEQIELPIYGAAKLGTAFRNYQRYKYSYELADHLGNVRAVVSKLKFMETATMEMEHYQREEAIFANVADTRQAEQLFNTTFNGSKVSLLNGGSTVIGPATSLEVKEGDKLMLDANVFFVEDNNNGVFPGLMAFLASSFGVSNGAGSETAHIYEGLENASNLLALSLTNSPNAPRAYLMCMVFDQDYVLIDPTAGGYDFYAPVPEAAATETQNISLEIDIPENAKYIYTYVANESAGTHVFFDDFTVKQLGVDITQTTDYYPGGSVANHWEKEPYRFGYQGEYSEEDEETGFNHFELRDYDSKINRWMTRDPARQYASPYMSMGNNWVSRVDPDGGSDIIDIYSDGRVEVQKTGPKDYYYYNDADGNRTFITSFMRNSNGLIQFPETFNFDNNGISFGISVKKQNFDAGKSYMSPLAVAALFGAAIETGYNDITITQFSYANGKSPKPSTSHKNGKNGDFRYLSIYENGSPIHTTDFMEFDKPRNTALISAFQRFGYTRVLSWPLFGDNGSLLPGTTKYKNHHHHFHLEGFKPNVKQVPFRGIQVLPR